MLMSDMSIASQPLRLFVTPTCTCSAIGPPIECECGLSPGLQALLEIVVVTYPHEEEGCRLTVSKGQLIPIAHF